MDELLERSRRYILDRTQWEIEEGTFQPLNPERPDWIARVKTTHLSEDGEPEEEFIVLASGIEFITLVDRDLPSLQQWLEAQSRKG